MTSGRASPTNSVVVAFCVIAVVLAFGVLVVLPRWMRDRAVSLLFNPDHRDEGMFYLVMHPIYRFKPRYQERVPSMRNEYKVNHVASCLQPEGNSICAVDFTGEVCNPGEPKGRMFLVDNDGAILQHSVPRGGGDLQFMGFDDVENWHDIDDYTNTGPADWNQGQ